VKFFKMIVLILWGVILLFAPVRAEVVDRIIAVVNDEIITLYEFNTAFDPYQKTSKIIIKAMIKRPSLNRQEMAYCSGS